MSALTNVQILKDSKGKPEYAVIPYESFLKLAGPEEDKHYIPHDVVKRSVIDGATPARAWREYLGLTQSAVAHRLKITQSAYSQLEKSASPHRATLAKIAKALKIDIEQLNF
ncbi:MAG: helix-turn-helix domain-containing protein [Burkholderiales bacterium]|jgi:DNA-binding XRE family transcriptional regulator|nr:helix-turn-helix domain-containing protein [Burkholderiales bacterium]